VKSNSLILQNAYLPKLGSSKRNLEFHTIAPGPIGALLAR